MYNAEIEQLISAALADGVLTEKEKQVLFKRAQEQGIDLDEFEMVLDARLVELQKVEKEKKEKSAPKSDKYGDVRKCPACGAIVGAFKGVCTECGYEFTNVDVNLASKKLHELLINATNDEKKKEIILTFPIPNSKADLLEFLTSLKPRILDVQNEFAAAYYKKYEECIEKAKIAFTNDTQLTVFVNEFPLLKKHILKAKIKSWLKAKLFRKRTIVVLALVFIFAIDEAMVSKKNAKMQYVFETHMENGDINSAKDALMSMDYDYRSKGAKKIIEACLGAGDVDNALYVYDKIYSVESTYQPLLDALIQNAKYDKAWDIYKVRDSEVSDKNTGLYADGYYCFMMDVISYLCKNNRKSEARQFIKEYSPWFEKYVDNGGYSFKKDYTYANAKAKLLQFVNNY